MRNITREFNDIGEKVTIQLKYEDGEVSKLPNNCFECPYGFMKHDWCNKSRDMDLETRPKGCQLKLVSIP